MYWQYLVCLIHLIHTRMSNANAQSRAEGDLRLTCEGKVMKAHSSILRNR